MVKYLFRMDDVCPTMDIEKFAAFERIFQKYKVKPLIGIVPDNKDPNLRVSSNNDTNFWKRTIELVNRHGWEVAQHGYQHVYLTKSGGILNLNHKSETSGLPYEEQLEILKKGQNILDSKGLHTDIYMAPSHSYDQNTLKALNTLKFNYITDGYSLYPYLYKNLTFVPCQMANPRKMLFGVYTFCIHANTSSAELIERFDAFIKSNIDHIISFEEATTMIKNTTLNKSMETTILQIRKAAKYITGTVS